MRRINALIGSFGLRNQADNIVGTPIRKGISGGQKRRLSVISQLITAPKILFLDEPTSGLDSTASFEVISFVKEAAKRNNVNQPLKDRSSKKANLNIVNRHLQYPSTIYHYFSAF
jgi:ABC-type multidrug transport system ATPase subunit